MLSFPVGSDVATGKIPDKDQGDWFLLIRPESSSRFEKDATHFRFHKAGSFLRLYCDSLEMMRRDQGIAEALRRDAEFEANPSLGITSEELDQRIESRRS